MQDDESDVAAIAGRAVRDALLRGAAPGLVARRADTALIITGVNAAFSSATGWTLDELRERRVTDALFGDEGPGRSAEEALTRLSLDGAASAAIAFRCADGVTAHARVMFAETDGGAETAPSFVALLFDDIERTEPERPADAGGRDKIDMTELGAAPLIDLNVLGPLLESVGVAQLQPAIDAFKDSSRDLTAQIKAAASLGDADEARRLAHALKGASANIGAVRLSRISYLIERRGPVEDAVDQLAATTSATLDALSVVFRNSPAPAS